MNGIQKRWGLGINGKNKDKINEVLGNRVKENCAYENVYTLALRGLHDAAMEEVMSHERKGQNAGECVERPA